MLALGQGGQALQVVYERRMPVVVRGGQLPQQPVGPYRQATYPVALDDPGAALVGLEREVPFCRVAQQPALRAVPELTGRHARGDRARAAPPGEAGAVAAPEPGTDRGTGRPVRPGRGVALVTPLAHPG